MADYLNGPYMLKKITLITSVFIFCNSANAGGVSLGATRLIYPTDQDQVVLKIYNSDTTSNYLVQSWITDENDKKISGFIITPPLFIIKAGSDSLLNVVYTGDKSKLYNDREKLYFLNAKVIPSLNEDEKKFDNALLISTTTKIKMFMRPNGLKGDSFTSYKRINCSYENGRLKIDNPTQFYMNITGLKIGGKEVTAAETIAPMTAFFIDTNAQVKDVKFNFINDYGVQIKDNQCRFG